MLGTFATVRMAGQEPHVTRTSKTALLAPATEEYVT